MQRRQSWNGLPQELRERVGAALGSPVIEARSQSGGFSPGSADRVTLADGRRAFVKALQHAVNAVGYDLHRTEARVLRVLPAHVAAPALHDCIEHDGWVALIVADIDGRQPTPRDVTGVLNAFGALGPITEALAFVPRLSDALADDVDGWSRLAADGAHGSIDPWTVDNLDRLRASAGTVAEAVDGDALVHLDARADNVIVTDGGPVIVDWPWASRGAAWFDSLTYLLDERMREPLTDVQSHLAHPIFASASADAIDAVLATLAGSFLDRARTPAPPGMPTLRAFQRAEGLAALDWLRERWT